MEDRQHPAASIEATLEMAMEPHENSSGSLLTFSGGSTISIPLFLTRTPLENAATDGQDKVLRMFHNQLRR